MVRDLYSDLQVTREAHPEVIKSAYRALCKLHHPDINPDEENGERMQEINAAYEVLRCEVSRKAFDEELDLLDDVEFDDFDELDDDENDDEDDEFDEHLEVRRDVEKYISMKLELNSHDRFRLTKMSADELLEILKSFEEKPKSKVKFFTVFFAAIALIAYLVQHYIFS